MARETTPLTLLGPYTYTLNGLGASASPATGFTAGGGVAWAVAHKPDGGYEADIARRWQTSARGVDGPTSTTGSHRSIEVAEVFRATE